MIACFLSLLRPSLILARVWLIVVEHRKMFKGLGLDAR
jgi:hypothetical protein